MANKYDEPPAYPGGVPQQPQPAYYGGGGSGSGQQGGYYQQGPPFQPQQGGASYQPGPPMGYYPQQQPGYGPGPYGPPPQ